MDMIKKAIDLHLKPSEWMMFQLAIYNACGTDVKEDTDDIIQLVRNKLTLHNQAYVIRIGSQCVTEDGHVQGDPGDWRDFYYDWDPRFSMYGESLEEAFKKRDQLHDVGMEAEVEHWGCGWKAMAEHGYDTPIIEDEPTRFTVMERYTEDSEILEQCSSFSEANKLLFDKHKNNPKANMITMEIALDMDGSGETPWYVVADWDYRETKK